jgi:hypothetical protein
MSLVEPTDLAAGFGMIFVAGTNHLDVPRCVSARIVIRMHIGNCKCICAFELMVRLKGV